MRVFSLFQGLHYLSPSHGFLSKYSIDYFYYSHYYDKYLISRYNHNTLAFLAVIIHAFLGHVDGIVAKVHRSLYPQHDSPLLNNFLVAFCNKIVNILTLLVVFQSANFDNVSIYAMVLYCMVFYAVIGYDSLISIIRVYDYFETRLNKYINLKLVKI
jgi:hypothetical protein